MIGHDVLCLGLTRLQFHTLRCHFPFGFSFYNISSESLLDDMNITKMVSEAWCAFINPKKLQPGQLSDIVDAHTYATEHTHAAILLFTDAFTQEQREAVNTKNLIRVDLCAGFDKPLRDTIDVLRKATMPCWDGMAKMRSNMLNDGWYLIDMETTGTDPLEDEIICLTVSFMADYKIESVEKLYIKQSRPLSERVKEITGITDEMLEQGITREEAVKYLRELPSPSPFVFEYEKYFLPFMKELFHLCGEKFDIPCVTLDGLASIVFCYALPRTPKRTARAITSRKYERTPVEDVFIERLYDVTLAVFENLQDRYGVRSAGDFHTLYYGEIECGE